MTDTAYNYWTEARKPHASSLANLRKMSRFMMENGFTVPGKHVSARQISLKTGVTYTQVLNLIHRPGFVQVLVPGKQQSSGWYYLSEFGLDYPETLPGGPIVKEVKHTSNDAPTFVGIAEQKVAEQICKRPHVEDVKAGLGEIVIKVDPPSATFDAEVADANVAARMFLGPRVSMLMHKEMSAEEFAGECHKFATLVLNGQLNIIKDDKGTRVNDRKKRV